MARSVTPTALMLACLLIAVVPRTVLSKAKITGCPEVLQFVSPCITYASGSTGGAVPDGCCKGLRGLHGIVKKSTKDRQTTCSCLQAKAKSTPRLNHAVFAETITKCDVDLPYAVNPSIDCSKVL